ncbi:MAG: protein disulfide oxidoreductase [Candidatus Paceibacteria bacterium]
MAMIDAHVMEKVRNTLLAMKEPVKLIVFKSKFHESGELLEQLAHELSQATSLISVEVKDYDSDKKAASEFGVTQPSTLFIAGKEKRFVKVLGLPSGHEFFPFLQTIIDVSRGYTDLPTEIERKAKAIDFPVTIKVFVTPTCPYCPGAVRLAHGLAIINPNIHGEMVEAMEFPELSQKYEVSGVPKTVINDIVDLVGAYPADIVLKKIMSLKI